MEEAEPVAEEIQTVVEEVIEDSMDSILKAIVAILAPYMANLEKVEEEMSALKGRFNKIAAEPAAKKITSSFSRDKEAVSTAAEARFAKLVEMRKSGSKLN
jgi:hypothetical protein